MGEVPRLLHVHSRLDVVAVHQIQVRQLKAVKGLSHAALHPFRTEILGLSRLVLAHLSKRIENVS